MTMTETHQQVRNKLEKNILRRRASLSEEEAAFLHALLVDDPPTGETNSTLQSKRTAHMSHAAKVLDDDILFSVPFETKPSQLPQRTRRSQTYTIGLWRAHEEGVAPSTLASRHSKSLNAMNGEANVAEENRDATTQTTDIEITQKQARESSPIKAEEGVRSEENDALVDADAVSIRSDEEVRAEKEEPLDGDDNSTASSWDMNEGGFDHYDAWAVLKDEYAGDFGFDYSERGGLKDYEDPTGTFQILGTSADDESAQPHVLSPPLMEALLNFVPEHTSNDNYWLRFSLVRDGAALSTLKQYVRAASPTVLAIETTKGDVFGVFLTTPWRNHVGYYGSGRNTFLWKMRHNRLTPCHSLFEQAHMENEIDVYCYSGLNTYVQLCTNDRMAVGGGVLHVEGNDPSNFSIDIDDSDNLGFGLSIDDSLLEGTSSPCATFRNPCLVGHSSKGEAFEIVNMEIWSFTPSRSIDEAQKLELSKFYVQESILSSAASSRSTTFSSHDLNQQDFYRRVGQRDESEVERERWQYSMMMNAGGATSTMHSPNITS